jgi:hypothetical protein
MIATASYATAQRSGLMIVQTSVGTPKWLVPLPQLEAAKPYGIFGQGLDWPEFSERYLEHLSHRWGELERDLHALTREWPRIALCCWCRDPSTCHRRLLAQVIKQHGFGPVHEVGSSGAGTVHGAVNGTTEPAHNAPCGHVPQPPRRDAEPAQMSLTDEENR